MSAEETLTYRSIPPANAETRLVSIDIVSGAIDPVPTGPGLKIAPTMPRSGEIAYIRKDTKAGGIFYGSGRPGPKGADLRSTSWSPDARHVVYHRVVRTDLTAVGAKLWSRNRGYELRQSGAPLPAFDPSGNRYVATSAAGSDWGLLLSGGAGPMRVVFQQEGRNVFGAQWSPKGDAIIFGLGAFNAARFRGDFSTSRLDGGAQVAIIKPDGSGFHEVTSGPNNNAFPSFSPNGRRFVYRTAGPGGDGLRIKDLDSGQITTLTTEYDNFPLWSPRGDLIAFVRLWQGDYEIFTIRPDGRDLRRLTYSPGNDSHGAWSPDGEWLLFSSTRMGFKDEALYTDTPQPYGELFVMRYDGTHVRQLTDNQWEDAGPAWQPTSKPGSKRSEP